MTRVSETSFRFLCLGVLKRSMGAVGSVVDSNEVAIRRFLSEAEAAEDLDVYLKAMAGRYGTKLVDVDLGTLGSRVRHLYIVSTYQQSEEFLQRLRAEHPRSNSWGDRGKLSMMEYVLRNVGRSYAATSKVVGKLEIDIFDYYRRVRNRFLHVEPEDEEQEDKKLEKTARKLRDRRKERGDLSRSDTPHGYHEMSHDDFVLFDGTVRHIARRICQAGKPDDEDIVSMVQRLDDQPESTVNLRKLKVHKQKPGRLEQALAEMLRSEFSLNKTEAQPVVKLLMASPPVV